MSTFALTAALLLSTGLLATGAPRIQAPDAPWKTLRTAHYVIHFPAGGDFSPFALEVAAKIEGIHAQVVEWVGFEVPRPIHVVIRDPQLEANGSALPFLDRPSVELWKTPPEADSAIGHFTSWVDLLVTHELTHIHHLMRPQNRPTWTDRFLDLPVGPVSRKAPRWVIEGYATVIEGKITGSGRPHSAYRAALLRQWALQGKLPDYGAVSGFGGFRGGNMAYLVGSAYLEWLERQNASDPEILKKFWKQLVSKKRRAFEPSFKATFGMNARDGYDRWRAEVTHDALGLERRAKTQNLIREGDVWARVEGEVTDLSVSPDGTKLLARVLTKDFRGLKVWDLAEKETDHRLDAKAPRKKKEEKADPNEVEDRKPDLAARKATWTLGRVEGRVPEKPEWALASVPNATEAGVRFSLRRPTEDGSLRRVGFRWNPSQKQISALPGGSPDAAAELAPKRAFGVLPEAAAWNLHRFGGEKPVPLTRTLSAAWNPAPTPDGKWLYYTQLTATGVEIRKLDLSLPPLDDQAVLVDPAPLAPDTVISKADQPSRIPAPVKAPTATEYQVGDSLWNRGRSGIALGPSGNSYQLGYGGSDILGRLSWLALAGVGDGAGPRGATVAALWRGWRWAPSLALFSALERPSAQRFEPVTGFDRERRGGEFAFSFESKTDTPALFRPFVAFERVEALETSASRNRTFAGFNLALGHRWLKGEHQALTMTAAAAGATGRTGGQAWNLQRGRLAFRFSNQILPLSLRGELARVGGAPTILDRLRLGGLETSLVPASLDLNRFSQDALPAFALLGDRARRWRGELGSGFRAYLEHTQVWSTGQPRPAATRVVGVEAALHDLLPTDQVTPLLGRIELTFGLHRPLDGQMKDHTVGTLSLIVRP